MRGRSNTRRSAVAAAPLLLGALGGVGCVNQSEYDNLYTTNRALEERNVQLQQQLEEREGTISLLRERVQSGDETLDEVRRRNAALNDDIVRLRNNYRSLSDRLDDAASMALDPRTDEALRELAAQSPDLIRFDSERGVVRLASDLTFALGSVEVRQDARETLRRFAEILSRAEASGYQLRIVGHTDAVPVSRPETRRKHPTNMHLSAHRAISVRDVLTQAGLSAQRIQIAGWGPYRPAVPNPASGGAAENRRVEIYVLPDAWTGPAVTERASAPIEDDEPADRRRPIDPIK